MKEITIVGGKGQMGQMFTKKFQSIGKKVWVIDQGTPQTEQTAALTQSELIILSVPIEQTPALAESIGCQLRKDQIFSDFTSVKTHCIPLLKKTPAEVISSHPLFGPMQDLTNQNMLLLPVKTQKNQQQKQPSLDKMQALYGALKLNVKILPDWEKHDEIMSVMQGLMHFMHIVFSHTLEVLNIDVQQFIEIASPVYRANFAFACRIMNRNPELYTHILMDNPKNLPVLHTYLSQAQETLNKLHNKDLAQFVDDFHIVKDFLGKNAQAFAKESDYLVQQMSHYDQNVPK